MSVPDPSILLSSCLTDPMFSLRACWWQSAQVQCQHQRPHDIQQGGHWAQSQLSSTGLPSSSLQVCPPPPIPRQQNIQSPSLHSNFSSTFTSVFVSLRTNWREQTKIFPCRGHYWSYSRTLRVSQLELPRPRISCAIIQVMLTSDIQLSIV